MTREEWLDIGYDKHIIEDYDINECLTFFQVYKRWFLMKLNKNRGTTVDRIEVTYRRYYMNRDIENKYIHTFTVEYICEFLNDIIINNNISLKEFRRIYQIVNNVLCYALDLGLAHASLIDWARVKRYIYALDFNDSNDSGMVISVEDRNILFNAVLHDDILPDRRCACLLILLNFYLGLRLGELSALKFSDFDIESKLLRLSNNEIKFYNRDNLGNRLDLVYSHSSEFKTKKSKRVIPLVDKAIEIYSYIVNEHKYRGYETEYLCYDGRNIISSCSIIKTLNRLCKLCGIRHIPTHDIRKTYASELHYAGVPTRIISDILGHSSVSTTQKCYILGVNSYDNYYDMLNDAVMKITTI